MLSKPCGPYHTNYTDRKITPTKKNAQEYLTMIRITGLAIPVLSLFLLLSAPAPAPASTRVANPFIGAQGYIDPDYVRNVEASMAKTDPATREKMQVATNIPTAVWLDSIAAIEGSNGRRSTLEQHLLDAVSQAKENTPVVLPIVVYNLPDRDCSAKASNGTLNGLAGLKTYREDFIDRIATLFADKRFSDLRIVTILEPDSLPNLVTNKSVPDCQSAFENGIYTKGIAYALKRFNEVANVYSYLDIGHSGWLGWDDNRKGAVKLYVDVIKSSGSLFNVHGVATNTSGYTPVEEYLLPDTDYKIGNMPIKAANFYQYNGFFDERDYANALKAEFSAAGIPDHFGILIDTSRNGWGGKDRPTKAGRKNNINQYVNSARIDRRPARQNWCNQNGAGAGERPTPNPFNDGVVHAFLWIKPPGESDGTSDSTQTTADAEGKRFDSDCDPQARTHSGNPTGAIDGAPAAGRWFHQHFEMLVRNAYPPLSK